MQFRVASFNELEMIFGFWTKIFRWDDKRIQILKNSVSAGLKSETHKILLLEFEGKLVGSVLNIISTVFYDDIILNKASVGEVSIDPSFQGKGLGHKLMEENQKFLDSIGIDFARLGGLTKFYSRFGYVAVPTKTYEVNLSAISGGVKKITVADLITLKEESQHHIRELVLPDELPLWIDIHNEFHKKCFFSEWLSKKAKEYWHLRSTPADNIHITGYFESDNKLSAYVMSWGDALENIVDIGYINASDCIELLKYHIRESEQRGAKKITFAFAEEEVLSSLGLITRKIESLTRTASTMISIIDIDKFFRKMKPVLIKRLSGTLFEKFGIKINIADIGKSIEFNECKANNMITVEMSYRDLMLLVFNYKSVSELADDIRFEGSKSAGKAMLSIIFPYTGNTFVSFA